MQLAKKIRFTHSKHQSWVGGRKEVAPTREGSFFLPKVNLIVDISQTAPHEPVFLGIPKKNPS